MQQIYNKLRFLKIRNELISKLKVILQTISDSSKYQKITKEIEEIEVMIDEILTSSTKILETAHQKKYIVNIATILESVCAEMQSDNHKVSLNCETTTAFCLGNALVFKRIFRNIINNAIKYGNNAHVTLKSQHNNIIITIDDEGPGIPKDEIKKVFEPFYRSEKANTSEIKGSGIGLAFAKLAVLVYQGSLKLDNLPKKGLRVAITLKKLTPKYQSANISIADTANKGNKVLALQIHTLKLAALSHDLLNMITRLRLRTQLLDDKTQRIIIENTLVELESMMKKALTYTKKSYQTNKNNIEELAAAIPTEFK